MFVHVQVSLFLNACDILIYFFHATDRPRRAGPFLFKASIEAV